ncbi:37620_t:CDS:2, partial [Gigaspora margarita]
MGSIKLVKGEKPRTLSKGIEPSKSIKIKTTKNKATTAKSKRGKIVSKSGSVQKPTTRRKPQKASIAKNPKKPAKVTISTSKRNKKLEILNRSPMEINIEKELGGIFLPPGDEIYKYFDEKLTSGHIHIIVQPPTT